MTSRMLRCLIVATGLVTATSVLAEDIDLFAPVDGRREDIPNVLFMIDNTANWNTAFANEIGVLIDTFENLAVNADGSAKFRVGVMLATETGKGNNNVSGGYVRAAIRDMTGPGKGDNKGKYAEMLSKFGRIKDQGNAGKSGWQMAEAYFYFSGGTPYAGNGKAKTDFLFNDASDFPESATVPEKDAMRAIYALPDNALQSKDGIKYLSPVPEDYCGQNYIIYISNGPNQQSGVDDRLASEELTKVGGDATPIALSPSGSQSNPSDEWTRFMRHKSPLGIVTYTLDVDRTDTGQGPGWTALLRSMARESGGKYFDVSSGAGGSEIARALGRILSEIQTKDSAFASVSLPLSVNTQGTYLNQVFVGMFRPDVLPRWDGNLKQYRLELLKDTDDLVLVDADGDGAINAAKGFIAECARSYWTTADGYWAFSPRGTCKGSESSNAPDGDIVEKGAQGQRLRASPSRNMTTCKACGPNSLLPAFSEATVTADDLGVAEAERLSLIQWARGLDVKDEDEDSIKDEMRPSVHGDVVHSRPIALNFGDDVNRKVVVFYGANDGALRAINGNRDAAFAGVGAGGELWSFMAPEFFGTIKRMHDNAPRVSFKTIAVPPEVPTASKPYGFDGAIASYTDGGKTWLFTTLRRAGRSIYAFDVSKIADAAPENPGLLWRAGCPPGDEVCPEEFKDIGQTWSTPKVLKTASYLKDGKPAPMLIFGGGYDNCEDGDPNDCGDNPNGSAVYLLDAETGKLLQKLETERGVVGDVFVVPDGAGLGIWAYVADLGGNVYRISGANAVDGKSTPLSSTDPSEEDGAGWQITKIASLGFPNPGTEGDCKVSGNRKFMFSPDAVADTATGTYYLVIGSGDREKPLDAFSCAYKVQNYFFMIKDRPLVKDWHKTIGDADKEGLCMDAEGICLSWLLPIGVDEATKYEDSDAWKGWRLELKPHEQVVTSAITVFGTTTFSTHTPEIPAKGACSAGLGTARVYNIRYFDASSRNGSANRYEVVSGGGLPPSPVAGRVKLDDGTIVPFVIGGSADSPLQSKKPIAPGTSKQPKSVTYWYIEK